MENAFWIEDIPEDIGNKFLAVNIVAKRARQLRNGAMAKVKIARRKETTVSLEETFKGMLEYQVQPIEEKRLLPPETTYGSGDDYDLPAIRFSNSDEVFKKEETDFDVFSDNQ